MDSSITHAGGTSTQSACKPPSVPYLKHGQGLMVAPPSAPGLVSVFPPGRPAGMCGCDGGIAWPIMWLMPLGDVCPVWSARAPRAHCHRRPSTRPAQPQEAVRYRSPIHALYCNFSSNHRCCSSRYSCCPVACQDEAAATGGGRTDPAAAKLERRGSDRRDLP